MKKFYSVCLFVAGLLVAGTANVDAAKKQKGMVIPEGDPAVLTVVEKTSETITFPDVLTDEYNDLYTISIADYMVKCKSLLSSDGADYDGIDTYVYLHNSTEWLHKGQFSDAWSLPVKKIKEIKIYTKSKRLRDMIDQMPLMRDNRDRKNDQNFQQQVLYGEDFNIYVDITVRDNLPTE